MLTGVMLTFAHQTINSETDTAASTISIAKILPELKVQLKGNNLTANDIINRLNSTICLDPGQSSTPYRVQASSMNATANYSFRLENGVLHVPYSVFWSNGGKRHRLLPGKNHTTPVFLTGSQEACDDSAFLIEVDEQQLGKAQKGSYIDTLTLVVVVE